MNESTPVSVGLGGDGDEIAATFDVERAFGVKLDYANCKEWLTAGDVFEALQKALPPEQRNAADLWERFATALCGTTGIDPCAIEPRSPLLPNSRFWARMMDACGLLWKFVVVVFAIVVATAVLTNR